MTGTILSSLNSEKALNALEVCDKGMLPKIKTVILTI